MGFSIAVILPWYTKGNDAAVLLYAPGADPYFEELVKNGMPTGCFTSMRADARVVAKAIPRTQKSQMILEAFS